MKGFIVAIFFCFSAASYADCSNQLIQSVGADKLPAEKIACIKSSPSFLESLNSLCNDSRSDYSVEYKKYLEHESRYYEKVVDRDNATTESARKALNMDLRSLFTQWNIYGYRYEIEPYTFAVSYAVSNCVQTR